jgi:hypothetical protein
VLAGKELGDLLKRRAPTRTPKGSNMNRTVTLVISKAVLRAGLAVGFAAAPHGTAHADDT